MKTENLTAEEMAFEKEVNSCFTLDQLFVYRCKTTPDSSHRKIVDSRTTAVLKVELPEIINPYRLTRLWELLTDHESYNRELVESRMEVVYRQFLPSFEGMNELIYLWKRTSAGSRVEAMIESRMIELLASITAENAWRFNWFEEYCEELPYLPSFIIHDFEQKRREVYECVKSA